MAGYTTIFKRYEKKYLINSDQYESLIPKIENYISSDKFGKSTISNIYFDTDDFRLIRNSISSKCYKEKLRIRTYCVPNESTDLFFELKKKCNGIIFKRREIMSLNEIDSFLHGSYERNSQILREIKSLFNFYGKLSPKVLISYDREAYFVDDNPFLRITFDRNPRFRSDDLDLRNGSYGKMLIDKDFLILEYKSNGTMPLWLSDAFDKCGIFPTSFSKYAKSYECIKKGN